MVASVSVVKLKMPREEKPVSVFSSEGVMIGLSFGELLEGLCEFLSSNMTDITNHSQHTSVREYTLQLLKLEFQEVTTGQSALLPKR